jgi:hypothetical protein
MRHRATPDPRVFDSGSREQAGFELLQTIAAIASVLGFLISLATLPPCWELPGLRAPMCYMF